MFKVNRKKEEEQKSFKVKSIDTKNNEKLAKELMNIDIKIWKKHGWNNADMVQHDIFSQEVKQELDKKGIKEIPYLQYHILEDANYHTMNSTLEGLNVFKKGETYASAEKEYLKYLENGGKTWEL